MSMSPEFKKIYSLNGSGGGSPQSNNNSYSSPNNRSNNQTLSPTMRAGAGRTIGTFGIGPEGGGGHIHDQEPLGRGGEEYGAHSYLQAITLF